MTGPSNYVDQDSIIAIRKQEENRICHASYAFPLRLFNGSGNNALDDSGKPLKFKKEMKVTCLFSENSGSPRHGLIGLKIITRMNAIATSQQA